LRWESVEVGKKIEGKGFNIEEGGWRRLVQTKLSVKVLIEGVNDFQKNGNRSGNPKMKELNFEKSE